MRAGTWQGGMDTVAGKGRRRICTHTRFFLCVHVANVYKRDKYA